MKRANIKLENLGPCVQYGKYAVHAKFNFEVGEWILLQLVKSDLARGEKRIQYILVFDDIYPDTLGESERIWGKPFDYIVNASTIYSVYPFNLDEVIQSNISYDGQVTVRRISIEDAHAVRRYVQSRRMTPVYKRTH